MKAFTMRARVALVGVALGIAATTGGATGQKFYPDDPIKRIVDSQDASGVQEWEIDLAYDTIENLFYWPGDRTPDVRAQNLNTIDEVPDSSWFTNRLGTVAITADDVVRGPGAGTGPAPGAWTVVSAKNNGVMPGFTVRDAAGQVWFIKFDAPGYPAMATGTEVLVSRLFWALGYHVPEVHLSRLVSERLTIDEQARITVRSGRRRHLKLADIRTLLRQAHRDADGSYRIVASRALPGRPLGGYRFYGTRSDDPNDVVPHEHRRELRGYGTFAAWLNHVDSKSINTLDTVVEQDGRQIVLHHLLDFGSAIGSAGVYPRAAYEGWEYLVQGRTTLAGMPSLGFYVKDWRTIPLYTSRSVGSFPRDNAEWDPELWKPRYPNSAFRSSRFDDKFWAARRLQAFSNELLSAAIRTGQFNDPASEEMLLKFLSERRNAIVRRYLPAVNPVVDVQLSATGELTFRNAAVEADVADEPQQYVVAWFRFDNATGAATPIAETTGRETRVAAPQALPTNEGTYVRAAIAAAGGPESWARPVHAYFRRESSGWRLVGFERVPGGNPPAAAGRRVAN